MHRNWRWVLPAYLWCLPMTLAGLVISRLAYKATSYKWYDGVLTCIGGLAEDGTTRIWGKPNAQTLGWLEIYDSEFMRGQANLRIHENVHVVQGFIGALVGLAMLPVLFAVLGWSPAWGLALGGFVGGLGFAALYGILFIYFLVKPNKQGSGWYDAYMANPFEIQAYKLQDDYLANPNTKPWGA